MDNSNRRLPGEKTGVWTTVRDTFLFLRPASFSIAVTFLAIPLFFYVDQGVEIIRSLGEGNQYDGKLEPIKLCWLGCALIIWSVNSWYWARVNLNLRTSRSVSQARLRQQPFVFLSHYGPRILGIAPLLIIAGACLRVAPAYPGFIKNLIAQRLLIYSVVCIAAAACLAFFFWARRRWLERRGVKSAWKHEEDHRHESFLKLPRGTLIAVTIMVVLSLAIFLTFLSSPVTAPTTMGTAAILALAAASWVCFGSFLITVGNSIHFPVISGLVVLAVVSSCLNDNHGVRILDQQNGPRLSLEGALDKWKADIAATFPQERRHPLFIVAAEGGGIRAAYWTATVLGTIQEKALEAHVDFPSHVFAVSGVSGGSLGAAVFVAEMGEGQRPETLTSAQDMLGEDFLSPALAAMLYGDFVQRFIPAKIKKLDRGRVLEMAWEDGWRRKVSPQSNRFERGMNDLFEARGFMVPALFLNATSVEAGRRVIVSNVQCSQNGSPTSDFIDSEDAIDKLNGKSMRLSTAAHLSARFTYVSPAGLFPDGQHVVDGGYFENSGETTVRDILQVVEANSDEDIVPIVIEIGNAPGGANPGTTAAKPSGEFLSDLMSPLYALLHTRDARGTYSQMLIRGMQYHRRPVEVFRFSLQKRSVPLPLGWMLTGGAAREMKSQIETTGPNFETVARIVDRLIHLP